MMHLQELAGNCACQRLAETKSPKQQALLATVTPQAAPRALTVLRLAEEEPAPTSEGAPEGEGCGLGVVGRREGEEEVAQTLARSAERRPVKLEEYGAEGTGSATVLCDGKGGYRVDLGMYTNMPCGVRNCVDKHERSHIEDFKPHDACKDIKNGELPAVNGDPEQFKKMTECKASPIGLACIKRTKVKKGCETVVKAYQTKAEGDVKKWCGG